MHLRLVATLLLLAVCTSCATAVQSGTTASTAGWTEQFAQLARQAQFDHYCPRERVRVIRSLGGTYSVSSVDVDVCGVARRYRYIYDNGWVDVTALFPASSLPAPLPPDAKPTPAGS